MPLRLRFGTGGMRIRQFASCATLTHSLAHTRANLDADLHHCLLHVPSHSARFIPLH